MFTDCSDRDLIVQANLCIHMLDMARGENLRRDIQHYLATVRREQNRRYKKRNYLSMGDRFGMN